MLQLAFSHRGPRGAAAAGLWASALPTLAARSLYGVTCLRVVAPDADVGDDEGSKRRWALERACHAATAAPTAHLAWGRRLAQRALVLCEDTSLHELSLEGGGGAEVARVWAGAPADLGGSRQRGVLRCAYAVHPRVAALALRDRLARVDLREGGRGGSMAVWYCLDQQQYLTALAAPGEVRGPSPSPSPFFGRGERRLYPLLLSLLFMLRTFFAPAPGSLASLQALGDESHLLLASTNAAVLLFDLRRPQAPVATWAHGMPRAPPDLLHLLPLPGSHTGAAAAGEAAAPTQRHRALLATSCWGGDGRLFEYRLQSEDEVLLASAEAVGRLTQLSAPAWQERQAQQAQQQQQHEQQLEFAWRPVAGERYHVTNPPSLLFSPLRSETALSTAVAEARIRQAQRAQQETEEAAADGGGREAAAGPADRGQRQRRPLPGSLSVGLADRRGPDLLGLAPVGWDWQTQEALPAQLVARCGASAAPSPLTGPGPSISFGCWQTTEGVRRPG